jgi:hypothetical protein
MYKNFFHSSLAYERGDEPFMRLVECLSTFLESEAFSAVGGQLNQS